MVSSDVRFDCVYTKDAFAGRTKADPIFWGARASSVVGITGTTAFPIFTDERLPVPGQFKQLADSLRLDVTAWAIVDLRGEPKISPSSGTAEVSMAAIPGAPPSRRRDLI